MNKFCKGASATLDGFSALAVDELATIEGGQTSMGWLNPTSVGALVQSFVNEATARYRDLKAKYG